jgi:hypothetical protein
MPRDPVKRKASKQRYNQSDKGKATAQAYDQSDQGKAAAQAARQRYNQSDKGAKAKAAAKAAASASASLAFVTKLKKLTHAQRVSDYFSEEELAAAADQVPYCPFYYGRGGAEASSA